MSVGDSWKAWGPEYGYNVEAHGFLTSLGFEDTTWHNDGAPSFQKEVDDTCCIRVWLDHEDPDQRELPLSRFCIARYSNDIEFEQEIWSGDSWLELAKQLRQLGE